MPSAPDDHDAHDYAERTRQIFRFLAEHQDALARSEDRVAAEFEKDFLYPRRLSPP